MADPRQQQNADFARTLGEGPGVGQMDDGTIDTFPLSEFPARLAQRDSEEEATAHAMEQSERGFAPSLDEEQDEDFADLTDAPAHASEA